MQKAACQVDEKRVMASAAEMIRGVIDRNASSDARRVGGTSPMRAEKAVLGFLIVLAATLNFDFYAGEIDNPSHHDAHELIAALVVSLVATVLTLRDRSQTGAVLLAASLVAELQLIAAAGVWSYATYASHAVLDAETMATVVSLSGGALFANVVSVMLLLQPR
jgi:hypothetical protein